jgi:opacity protein-like surface antigen
VRIREVDHYEVEPGRAERLSKVIAYGRSETMKRLVAVGFVLLMVLCALSATSATAPEATAPPAVIAGPHEYGDSSNWAGYVVSTADYAATAVVGSWVVPTFHGTCQSLDNESIAAFWVGIDGWNDGTVEQIGTSITCTSFLYVWGVSYSAWYELYPAGQVAISITIHPGDLMTAEVIYSPNTGAWTLFILDDTTGLDFSVQKTGVEADRSSAEWIAESPSNALGIVPLVDFGSVHFSNAYAVVGGKDLAISKFPKSDPYWQVDALTDKGVVKMATGGLSDAGKKFAVTWKTYGP